MRDAGRYSNPSVFGEPLNYQQSQRTLNSNVNAMDIQSIKQLIVPILKEASVSKAALFGSVARGENTGDSDIDLLVELPKGKSLFDLVDLKLSLEATTKKKVDILTFNSIHPPLRGIIEHDQVAIL